MDPVNDQPDVLGKVDALLTRHRTGTPSPQEAAESGQQADRASIPVLSEVVAEPAAIPVLTDTLADIDTAAPLSIEPLPVVQIDTAESAASRPLDEATQHRIEEFLILELEDRIAMEFAASLDKALTEMLDNSREHIRHAVREALEIHLNKHVGDATTGNS